MKKPLESLRYSFYYFAKFIYLLTDDFVLLFKGNAFCLLYNFRAFFLLKGARFYFESKDSTYTAIDGNLKSVFLNRRQALNAYRQGLFARSKYMRDTYHLSLVDFMEGDVVIDCGANVGDLLLYFRDTLKPVVYYGIEPSPSEFKCLRINAGLNKCYNLGLWNDSGVLDFFVSSDGADSSFIRPRDFSHIVSIESKRLDDLSLQHDRIKLLKLEAEGGEPEVLQGAVKLLSRVEYVSADLGFERGEAQKSTLCPVSNLLYENGFVMVEISAGRMVTLFKNIRF